MNWAPIRYRGFYDVPRIFLVAYKNQLFLFRCTFDDDLDDYPEVYKVYLMPGLTEADLEGNWEELFLKSTRFMGEVPVRQVRFDPTTRKEMDTTVIDNLIGPLAAKK